MERRSSEGFVDSLCVLKYPEKLFFFFEKCMDYNEANPCHREREWKIWNTRGSGYDFPPIQRPSEAFIDYNFFFKYRKNFFFQDTLQL